MHTSFNVFLMVPVLNGQGRIHHGAAISAFYIQHKANVCAKMRTCKVMIGAIKQTQLLGLYLNPESTSLVSSNAWPSDPILFN